MSFVVKDSMILLVICDIGKVGVYTNEIINSSRAIQLILFAVSSVSFLLLKSPSLVALF